MKTKKDNWNLSKKIFESKYMSGEFLLKFDVAEFIRRYKERLRKLGVKIEEGGDIIGVELAIYELKNLAGDKLQ